MAASTTQESKNKVVKVKPWRKIIAFFGPAYLVSVGYMDPGNWATDLAGGSRYGYALIWVLVMSNFIALLLQSLSARLGVVRGKDLAQCCREAYPKGLNYIFWILAEIAIAACDLAEVLGMAIGLQLLFGLPLIYGVLISLLDTFLLLWLQRLGMRKVELFIISLIAIIGMCFLVELFLAKPDFSAIAKGIIPSLPDSTALYIAIGIIGATVMPHNLYLHSALVQTRKIKKDDQSIAKALKYNFWDSTIALNLALFVNAAILILAASVFHKQGYTGVAELEDAHKLLQPLLGSEWAPKLFAIALIAAGQSSTVTGTLAGQIVMEGYLHLRINPALRRLITRSLAIIPAVLVILISGERATGQLLVFSQVLLSMQLAFAIIPLIHFVSNKEQMKSFAIRWWTKILSWIVTAVIVVLNLKLVLDFVKEQINTSDDVWVEILLIVSCIALVVLLVLAIIVPIISKKKIISNDIHALPELTMQSITLSYQFNHIALALDYSNSDKIVLAYALKLAQANTKFILIHITESASTQMMETETHDLETRNDTMRMNQYLHLINQSGYEAQSFVGHKRRTKEIARICNEQQADLLIVGSHGHRGVKDFIFGETVNMLRHLVKIPVFVAQ